MKVPSFLRFAVAIAKVPLFAVYGAWFLVAGWFGLARRSGDAVRLLALTLPCPSCGRENPIHGRFRCAVCKATYHGVVHVCGYCGAGASWFSCRCGISIPLRRPS
ncbi:MAG: hypothetical protein JWO36_2011 [Myxococcales bacterium]|nr:hypothetical protein [Myxococcales bacterium]